jgi:serine/threonine protein phosphatase PrpC
VLVVCDGVSSSIDSDVAALAGAEKARDVLVALDSDGIFGADSEDVAVAQSLVTATAEANQAVIAHTAPDSTNAASATFAAAVVIGDRVHYANLGDSRVYLLGADEQLLLSVDDSMAQAFIAEGMARAEAEALPRAHAITRWLGRDAVETVPRTGVQQVRGPGWVVVCSDGLWNYASAPEDLAAQLAAATMDSDDPVEVASRLVVWANSQGGQDNVTVALARVPGGSPVTLGATASDKGKEPVENG